MSMTKIFPDGAPASPIALARIRESLRHADKPFAAWQKQNHQRIVGNCSPGFGNTQQNRTLNPPRKAEGLCRMRHNSSEAGLRCYVKARLVGRHTYCLSENCF
jgi:hypothetical protein